MCRITGCPVDCSHHASAFANLLDLCMAGTTHGLQVQRLKPERRGSLERLAMVDVRLLPEPDERPSTPRAGPTAIVQGLASGALPGRSAIPAHAIASVSVG